jgi:Zn-dependent M16 (insulinase) family peptidase
MTHALQIVGCLCLIAAAALLTDCKSAPTPVATETEADVIETESMLDLAALTENESQLGFRTEALYTDDRDEVMGARFVHEHTGFVLDVLHIESVPQAFIWTHSIPDSDRGEPHTQEHLLLGKGNVGRYVASVEEMSLVDSSAFTQRVRTAYHLHTIAGVQVFFDVLELRLQSLLEPDYTDEEIRREVHHYGVAEDPDGTLRVEEGGTVYNEMVSSYERAGTQMWDAMGRALYGPGHPMALSSGGTPEGIREMTPEHIRDFHAAHYQLGGMGMIAVLPRTIDDGETLRQLDGMLRRLQPEPTHADVFFLTEASLPPAEPSPDRSVRFVDYPAQEAQGSVEVRFAWPPTLEPDNGERILMELFLGTLAGDANTNLYRRLVDSETRELDSGATSVYAGQVDWMGHPILVGLSGIPTAQADEELAADLQERVLDELRLIAEWPADSEELADFNRRLSGQLVAWRRDTRDSMSAPPAFGYRGTGAGWVEHLQLLERSGDFVRSVANRPEFAFVEAELARTENIWTGYIERWSLLTTEPYTFIARPSPELRDVLDQERETRLAEELITIQALYGIDDEQEVIARFLADYDAESERLEAIAAEVPLPAFTNDPPMSFDDGLNYRVTLLDGGITAVESYFASMPGAYVGLALRLDGLEGPDLAYLALLPRFLRRVGVIEEGEPLEYADMVERIQNEILSLSSWITIDRQTDRVELVISGSGTTPDEARIALRWMSLILYDADWRSENLPRLRDVVDQALTALRRTTQGREESWVNDPANAYRRQDSPLMLATGSFMTRTHNALRLKWLLTGVETEDAAAEVAAVLGDLAGLAEGRDRERLVGLLAAIQESDDEVDSGLESEWRERREGLSEQSRELVTEAAADLEATLPEIPDDSLAADWRYLCAQIAADLAVPPEETLAHLASIRDRIVRASGARIFAVGAESTLSELRPEIEAFAARLDQDTPTHTIIFAPDDHVISRLTGRRSIDGRPVFVGLVNPNTQGGVFLNSAPAASFFQAGREDVLNFLTGRMYGGGGAHSLFMKTWGAGLAYSNGVRADPTSGRIRYYAERCPELPQTLRFVIEQLEAVTEDPDLAEYALAQAFTSRAAGGYESRGRAIASDLADGRTPELVTAFRQAILDLREEGDLSAQIYERMADVYGQVLPGYGSASADIEGGVFFVIGPEAQFELYEAYLRSVEGEDSTLYRLYPRDFWMVGDTGLP